MEEIRNYIFVASSGHELARTTKKHNRLHDNRFCEELKGTLFVTFDWRNSLEIILEKYSHDPIKYFIEQATLAHNNGDPSIIVELEKDSKFYCVIRTPWDYVSHYGDFIKWLKILNSLVKENKMMAYNHPELLMWNSSKRYLLEIQDLWTNYSIIPSELVDKSSIVGLTNEEIIEKFTKKFNCDKLVFKPLISAGSYFTFVVSNSQDENLQEYAKETFFKMEKLKEFFSREQDTEYPDRDIMMVQPFMEEIVNDGEYSFLFINEKPSHMLWKRPQDGDFRVQGDYGGSNTCISRERFNATILENAQILFNKIKIEKSPNNLILYCRLDVIIDWKSNELQICELELLEPHLYFETINPNDKNVEIDCECRLYSSLLVHQ